MRKLFPLLFSILAVFLVPYACKKSPVATNDKGDVAAEKNGSVAKVKMRNISEEFKEYWYAGKAEITSYKLAQARYGELREGTASLIFVTEPFEKERQVKADERKKDNISVLKLNSTKKYLTGIYPYSIMNSSFVPIKPVQHALKVSTSVQEWCGHVYAQLNNKQQFEINAYSYFAKEGDSHITLSKDYLENELWNLIRIEPESLPEGEIKIIPSLEYLRTAHKEIKAYNATASKSSDESNWVYKIYYPELARSLSITFSKAFPYYIEGWEEETTSGYGNAEKKLVSTATRLKRINSAYWQQNSNADLVWRDSLGL